MCRWTLGPIERRRRVTVFNETVNRKVLFRPGFRKKHTFFSFSNVQINLEICRIARRSMCAYTVSVLPGSYKAADVLHARSKGYLTSVAMMSPSSTTSPSVLPNPVTFCPFGKTPPAPSLALLYPSPSPSPQTTNTHRARIRSLP
jgi:hypothetical protein